MQRDSPEHFALRHTNVSTPQLEHAASQHSVTATEDYQSAQTSRPASSNSNDGLIPPTHHFSTPPSTPERNPAEQHRHSSSHETDASTLRPRDSSEHRPNQIRRKPVGSGSSQHSSMVLSQMDLDTGPPTPGEDDTPYIRFAVDQLTRDEEVRGSRRYPLPGASFGVAEPTTHEPTGTLPTATTNQRSMEPRAVQGGEGEAAETAARKDTQQTAGPFADPPTPKYAAKVDPDFQRAREHPGPQHQRVDWPFPPRVDSRPSFQATAATQPSVFVPYDHEVPPLRFVPGILRPLSLGCYLILCLLMLAALLFSGIWSGTHVGLYEYTTFGGGRYFVFQYLPPMCGAFMLLWLFQIQIAIQRISPFIAMSSMSARARSQGPLIKAQPTNFYLPDFSNFKAQQPILGVCRLVFWLQIFTVPLLACLYNVYFYGDSNTGSWRWTTVQGIVWTLFALYLLLTIAVLLVLVYFHRRRTGLRWDARSIADLIAMLDRSNVTADYLNSESFSTARQFQQRLGERSDRLGYWRTSDRPNETFYGIGEEGAETRRYSLEGGRIKEKPLERSSFPPDTPSTAVDAPEMRDLESGESFRGVRHRYLPWYIRPSLLLLWALAAILLYVAFLVVSFVNRAVIHGFAPLTRVAPSAQGFSATNFTYSFIPSIIGQFLFLGWLSVDYAFRRLQPYAAMSGDDGNGVPAEKSLLLDYPARLPVLVGFAAVMNRDIRIAWFSTLSLIAATLPILAGGCFWAQFYIEDQQVRVAVEPSGYYALCVFLALYAFTLPLAFIGLHKRRLPHACTTIAEQVSFLYRSNLVGEREWQSPLGSRIDMITRLISARTDREQGYLSGSEGRFFFGKFVGRDGRTHLGIERVGRGQSVGCPGPVTGFRESSRPGTPRAGEQSRPTRQTQKPSEAYLGLGAAVSPTEKRAAPGSPLRRSMA